MLKCVYTAIGNIQRAVDNTLGVNNYRKLAAAINSGTLTVILASGNSVYPATYCNWLLRRCGRMSLQLTPLEYAVSMPAIDHNCLLFSQSARRGDSSAIETLCWRSDTPLYLVCDKCALSKDTVAKHLLESAGAGNVFVTSTCNEKAFLNISGTGAAYAVAYDIAASLGHTLPDTMPAMQWENLESYADKILLPEEENYLVLYGPAGRSAAEAFTGYLIESLGPTLAYDMKNFTHGVWRGLKE